jgi:hypothetical protein
MTPIKLHALPDCPAKLILIEAETRAFSDLPSAKILPQHFVLLYGLAQMIAELRRTNEQTVV